MSPESSGARRAAAISGWVGDEASARALSVHPDPATRATALRSLERLKLLADADLQHALEDPSPIVRRAAAILTCNREGASTSPLHLLTDDDPTVAEAAAFALGERSAKSVDAGAVAALTSMATTHHDALCREAAVASLGAVGAPDGLRAVLAATADIPAVRRRAALALAPFEGDDVDAALDRLADDHDWQVRQAVEDLRGPDSQGG